MNCSYWQYLLLFLIAFFPSLISAQVQDVGLVRRTFNKFFAAKQTDTTRAASFFVLPALGYAQETGLEFGVASSYNFYTDRTDPNSRTSTITLMGTATTEKQRNVKLNTDIWTRDNQYHILSEIRYRDWPFNFYGIGNTTQHSAEEFLGQRLFRARVDVERKVFSALYAGLNANFENFQFESSEPDGVFQRESFTGKPGGKHLILGTSVLYDTRDYTTYTTQGWYGRIKYGYAPNFFGGENFNGHQLETDFRHYHAFSSKFALASQLDYRGSYGPNTPFYVYNELGGDNMLRGYYLGRYRDKNFIGAQTEARYRFHPRVGITAFAGTGSTFSNTQKVRLVPSFGAGLRYFFDLEHRTTVRFDYAIGEKRPGEQRQKGFYLSLSEAF
ncbi:BamA/TamA family outer membrane protein [Sphingobacterium sp. lm-10]|uniref:BamA/TamA family outer membrane protein n=1 Tax=Sphingobacterium sp. lm-10 TaxID=2944904 RepID=UPI002021A291|nr:BamA/TamA family outer membrane protein [Sphingobacterium sp. lm-10]MCL7988082.1 BamA/TamA family outer membrane protein [Sphingobacterium sp. lm-10]